MDNSPANLLYENDIARALRAVGQLLEADSRRIGVVVIGGAALNLLGIVARPTRDVDIIALAASPGQPRVLVRPPRPLPDILTKAIRQVAKDFGLPGDWMNGEPAGQWDVGLPEGFGERVEWRTYGGLDVGIADRIDLIFFKLEATADQPSSDSRHFRDLVALNPSENEWALATAWVREKNVGSEYQTIVDRVIAHVARVRR